MLRLVLSLIVFAAILLGVVSPTSSDTTRSFVLYGNGSLDLASFGGNQAIDLSSGRLVGQIAICHFMA